MFEDRTDSFGFSATTFSAFLVEGVTVDGVGSTGLSLALPVASKSLVSSNSTLLSSSRVLRRPDVHL